MRGPVHPCTIPFTTSSFSLVFHVKIGDYTTSQEHFRTGFAVNWKAALTISFVPILFVSCSDAPPVAQQEEVGGEVEQLDAILRAYMEYTTKNDEPPKKAEDISEFFEDGVDKTKVFQSARDNQPYVIHWGVDLRKQFGERPLVLGYEKIGTDKSRLVLTAFGVMEMNPAQFQTANFPEGKLPAP